MDKALSLSTQCIIRLVVVLIGIVLIIVGALTWPNVDDGLIPMYEGIRTSVIIICVGIAFCFASVAGDILQRVIELEKNRKLYNQYNNQYNNTYNNPYNNQYNNRNY